jgi:hypothetical protein
MTQGSIESLRVTVDCLHQDFCLWAARHDVEGESWEALNEFLKMINTLAALTSRMEDWLGETPEVAHA